MCLCGFTCAYMSVCLCVHVGVSVLTVVPERETRRHFDFSQPPFCQEKVAIVYVLQLVLK